MPCMHINIKQEIPDHGKLLARIGLYIWEVMGVALFWNFICSMAALGCSDCSGQSVAAVCSPPAATCGCDRSLGA